MHLLSTASITRITARKHGLVLRLFLLLVLPLTPVTGSTDDPVRDVVNRGVAVNLADTPHLADSIVTDPTTGGLALEQGATQGVSVSEPLVAGAAATHLGVVWTADAASGGLGLSVSTSRDGVTWSGWTAVEPDPHLNEPGAKRRFGKLITVAGGYRHLRYSVGLARTEAAAPSPKLTALDFFVIDASGRPADGPETVVTERPSMLSRTAWGCPDGETSSNNPEPTYTDVTHLVVHHTATSNAAPDWAAEVRAIWSYHVQSRGWADIGYNFLVDPDGVVYVGRAGGDNVQGAHFTCQNAGTQGIALIGDFTSVPPTGQALDSLEDLLAWLTSREGLDPAAVSWHAGTQLELPTIAGHRDGNPSATGCTVTACPGDTFYPMLPETRVNVEALIAAAQLSDPVIRDRRTEQVARLSGDPDAIDRCYGVFEINGHVVANLHTAEHGCRLHRIETPGEAPGEDTMLADIDTTRPFGKGPAVFETEAPFRGWQYFAGSDGANGFWRTDGLVVEAVLPTEEWPTGGEVSGRGQMDGRLYFAVTTPDDAQLFFSTDGQDTRPEPALSPAGLSRIELVGSLLDTLLLVATDDAHGREPRAFDADGMRLLQDIVPGAEGSSPETVAKLEDEWMFVAYDPDGNRRHFVTDGTAIRTLPETGHGAYYAGRDANVLKKPGSVFTSRARPLIVSPAVAIPIDVVRLSRNGASSYFLGDFESFSHISTLAVVGSEAYALAENRFFRLGEQAAEEVPYNLPTDQAGVDLRFIGSNPYFPFAYLEETEWNVASRVWAWSEHEIGRLLTGDGVELSEAGHFRHIGSDTWFYAEDPVDGRTLRRIAGDAPPAVPWMGAVTGAWYDPATSGQGFVLHPIDDTRSVVSFYGYENDGTPLWLLGTGEVPLEPGQTAEITMHRSSGGNFGDFSPEEITTEPWGGLQIEFQTCREALASLDGASGQQTLQLERLAGLAGLECQARMPPAPHTAGVTGTWYDPATSGQGLVLHAIDESRILVSFYGYQDDSTRLWLLGVYEGEPAFARPLLLELTLAEGGDFGAFSPGDIVRSTWGTLSIVFHDCATATASLDGIDGRQTLALVKLAGLRGSGLHCPQTSTSND